MHTPETQQKFVERRAQGWTYARIASELGVAKSTLIEWSRKFRFDLQNRCTLELDELRDRVLGSRQTRVSRLTERLARIETELSQRSLADVSTARLFALAEQLRRQIERETADLGFVSPVKDIPGEEYVEEVQQWKA
jgi:transcriptional regulator with XRE-family HTH domain